MHGRDGLVIPCLAEKALGMLEEKLGAIGNRGVGREEVAEGLVGGRIARAEEGEHQAEASLDPHGFMRAFRGLSEELDRPIRLVPKELEPGALKSDPVADPRQPPVGQVEL